MQSNKPLHRICKWIPSETISKRDHFYMLMPGFFKRRCMIGVAMHHSIFKTLVNNHNKNKVNRVGHKRKWAKLYKQML